MAIKFTVVAGHPLELQDMATQYLNELLSEPLDDNMLEVKLEPQGPAYVMEETTVDTKVRPSLWGCEYVATWGEPKWAGQFNGVRLAR